MPNDDSDEDHAYEKARLALLQAAYRLIELRPIDRQPRASDGTIIVKVRPVAAASRRSRPKADEDSPIPPYLRRTR